MAFGVIFVSGNHWVLLSSLTQGKSWKQQMLLSSTQQLVLQQSL